MDVQTLGLIAYCSVAFGYSIGHYNYVVSGESWGTAARWVAYLLSALLAAVWPPLVLVIIGKRLGHMS